MNDIFETDIRVYKWFVRRRNNEIPEKVEVSSINNKTEEYKVSWINIHHVIWILKGFPQKCLNYKRRRKRSVGKLYNSLSYHSFLENVFPVRVIKASGSTLVYGCFE